MTSTPKTGILFGGAFDLGKNRRNIERVLGAVSAILSRKPPTAQSSPGADAGSPAERLAKLGDLLDKGLITSAELETRKNQILSEI